MIHQEEPDRQERAFRALLEYEKNCQLKYDYPDMRPSKPIPKGEQMADFGNRFGVTVEQMKEQSARVEYALRYKQDDLGLEGYINKFENGKKRYQHDAVFNKIVSQLYRGADPLRALDIVLKLRFEAEQELADWIRRGGAPPTIIKQEN